MPSWRAYPRMRGGTHGTGPSDRLREGLSPHARGNPVGLSAHKGCAGPIPACAGEPRHPSAQGGHSGAYPRMRGGTYLDRYTGNEYSGLSPHARGNRGDRTQALGTDGPIPACAGEPVELHGEGGVLRAYPRMRGGTRYRSAGQGHLRGLSPHARGNLDDAVIHHALAGPIPACAGEPACAAPCSNCVRAYPRMRGGTTTRTVALPCFTGLSPHARGNPMIWSIRSSASGPIPACAGEPR